ncbi:S1 family peptidase [Nocardia sp. NPDC006044]|uniref:S1 family peptidase n=1 Tax=Nocardia sp. NPDC006044 TaxID=3364306 RepID=UPI0036C2FADE
MPAGSAYVREQGGEFELCTTGFHAVDAAGGAVALSAGHCAPTVVPPAGPAAIRMVVPSAAGPELAEVGRFAKRVNGEMDYSIIAFDESWAPTFSNNLVSSRGAADVAVTGVTEPVVGAPVCKSGALTGFTCGTITAVEVVTKPVDGARRTGMFMTDVPTFKGDSGGPVMSGPYAVGLVSGGGIDPAGLSVRMYAQPLTAVLAANPGLRITIGST